MKLYSRFRWRGFIGLFITSPLLLFFLFTLSDASRAAKLSLATPTLLYYLPFIARQATPTLAPTVVRYFPFISRQPTVTPTPSPVLIPPDDVANEQYIADRLNQLRTQNGLPTLQLVSELTQSARTHSRDMADHNYTSHTGSDGSNGGERMQRAGYSWLNWSEIIGWGFQGDPARMMDWWMNSSIHRQTILSIYVADFGVGYARNTNSTYAHYWTVNFGRRASSSVPARNLPFLCQSESISPAGGSSVMFSSPTPCK